MKKLEYLIFVVCIWFCALSMLIPFINFFVLNGIIKDETGRNSLYYRRIIKGEDV